MGPTSPNELSSEDYSPSATLIIFPTPIPLLRGPTPITPTDDPSLGPHTLSFPTRTAFFSALASTRAALRRNCLSGARMGCSVAASHKCAPPWWRGATAGGGLKERGECEEREMRGCLVGVEERCEGFVRERCLGAFGAARVSVGRGGGWVRGREILGDEGGDGDKEE